MDHNIENISLGRCSMGVFTRDRETMQCPKSRRIFGSYLSPNSAPGGLPARSGVMALARAMMSSVVMAMMAPAARPMATA